MSDFVQKFREAMVNAIDGHASLTTITGRSSINLVSADYGDDQLRPVMEYSITLARQLSETDWRIEITFTGVADADRTVNEMLSVIEQLLTNPVMVTATPKIDLYRVYSDESRGEVVQDDATGARFGITTLVVVAALLP